MLIQFVSSPSIQDEFGVNAVYSRFEEISFTWTLPPKLVYIFITAIVIAVGLSL